MALFDFPTRSSFWSKRRPSVDPVLEEQLRRRGMTNRLPELRAPSETTLFRREFRENLSKGAVVGRQLAEGLAGAIVAPEISRVEQQNLEAKIGLLKAIREETKKEKLTPERRTRLLKMAESIDPQVAKEIPELQLTNKQVLGSAAELALLAATGFKPGTQGLIPSVRLASREAIKTVKGLKEFVRTVKAEERIRKLGPTVGKIANIAAKRLPQLARDAAGGGLFFGVAEAARGGSKEDITKQAGLGAGISAVAPFALEGVTRAIGASGKFVGRKVISPLAKKIVGALERVAEPTLKKGAGLTETERTLSVIPSRFQGLKQKAAAKTLGGLDFLKKLPGRFTDRFSVIKRIEDKILEMKGGRPLSETEKVYRDARLASATAEGKAELAATRLFGSGKTPGIMTPYKDVENLVVARLIKLDALDRARLGQKVASGENVQQLEEGLKRLIAEAGADDPRVVEAVTKWNQFQQSLLQQRVNAGLINKATVDNLIKTHPNYIPHRVVFELDEQIIQQVGRESGSLNVAKTDILTAKGSERALEDPFVAALQNLPRTFGVMEKNKTLINLVVAQEKFGVVEGMRKVTAKQPKGTAEQTINLFRNGIKETWVVPEDLVVAIKNLDNQAMGAVMRTLTAPVRILKALATRFNISFTVPNKLRDKQTAWLTADAFIQDMVKRSGAKPTGEFANLADDELYKLWKESGGAFGSIFREGRPSRKTIEIYQNRSWIKNLSNEIRPDKVVDNLNTAIEESTRLEVFKKALASGLSPKDAAFVARDATIDFAKMGTWMRNLNEIVPFLNARVQGAINVFRAAKLGPEQFARAQMWTSVYPSMAVYAHNRRFESSKNIPQYFYDQYWPIMIGEQEVVDDSGQTVKVPQFISIRKGEGQQLVANPLMWWLRRADGADPRRVGEMITNTIGSFSPVAFGGTGFGEQNLFLSLVSQFGPVANIAVGLGTNIDPFSGQKIIPESRVGASPEQQFKKTTPETTRQLANSMNVSPARLEFVLNSFGGVPRDVQELANLIAGAASGEGLRVDPLTDTKTGQATKLPVVRRFIRESTGFGSALQQSQEEFKGDLETQIIDKRLRQRDEAAEIWDEIKDLNRQEQSRYLRSIKASPRLVKDLKQLKKNRTSFEVLTPNDSTELRARYIFQRIKEMEAANVPLQERREFLRELRRQKIYTEDVKQKFRLLQRGRELD